MAKEKKKQKREKNAFGMPPLPPDAINHTVVRRNSSDELKYERSSSRSCYNDIYVCTVMQPSPGCANRKGGKWQRDPSISARLRFMYVHYLHTVSKVTAPRRRGSIAGRILKKKSLWNFSLRCTVHEIFTKMQRK